MEMNNGCSLGLPCLWQTLVARILATNNTIEPRFPSGRHISTQEVLLCLAFGLLAP